MTRDALLNLLREAARSDDPEDAHISADAALLVYLNDPEIQAAYENITRWYA